MKKILFVTAHSMDYRPVGSTEEIIAISNVKDNATFKDEYELDTFPNVTEKALLDKMKKSKPYIFHFSGHGDKNGKPLLFNGFVIESVSFRKILKNMKGLKCVFLNSCNSVEVINIIGDVVDYSIGIKGEIPTSKAVEFAKVFYENLCEGKPIYECYDKSLSAIEFLYKDKFTPIFKIKNNFIMEKIVFENKNEYLDNLPTQLLPFIEQARKHWENNTKNDTTMYERLLSGHPYPLLVDWFIDRKKALAKSIADEVLKYQTDNDREDLFWDLCLYFNLLDIIMVNMDSKNINSESYISETDTAILPQNFSKEIYYNSLDILIDRASYIFEYSKEDMFFFSDRVSFFKSKLAEC